MNHWVLEYRYADMDARARVRPEHVAYLTRLHEQGTVLFGGPIDDGLRAMVLFRAPDEQTVRDIVAADPFTLAGVGVDHVIRPWQVAIGAS